MPRTKQRTPELKDRVLHSAVALLESDGIPGLTTRRVARDAQTSTPAVYELFGDRAGLVREVFFEGFRRLADHLQRTRQTDDPVRDLTASIHSYRRFVIANPALAQVMFSRPFADFDPGPAELAAGEQTRQHLLNQVRRCIDHGTIAGNATDIAHLLLALARGLAAQETAGILGTSKASRDRRWRLAIHAVLCGLHPKRPDDAVIALE